MKFVFIALAVVVVATLRLRRQRSTRRARVAPVKSRAIKSDVTLIVAREVRERVRGRVFRLGTLFILIVVAAAIVIPVVHHTKNKTQILGVVGPLSPTLRASVLASASSVGAKVRLVDQSSVSEARSQLHAGQIDAAIVLGHELLVDHPLSASNASSGAQLVRTVAENLGIAEAFQAAHLSSAQASTLRNARALPIASVVAGKAKTANATSLIGIVLIFIMLSQYNTWILMGVMEEKSSRIIEVLLSALRPIQLLTGKVLGIGLVALAQAAFVVTFAVVLAKAVGSHLLQGSEPLVIASTLLWLVLGYAFYSWVYAAAGSMIERQDQVQSLVLPLSLPMIVGYVIALTGASSGTPSALVKVVAYLPPTAPFTMPLLVGFSAVTWWQFLLSALISVACTIGVARAAALVYRRSILRTGARVKLREVLTRSTRIDL